MKQNVSEQVADLGRQIVSFEGVEIIPKEIRHLLESNWRDQRVCEYLIENSEICRILCNNPANFEMLELVYFGRSIRGVTDGIDAMLSNSLSGQALRDRLVVVSDLVVTWLRNRPEKGTQVYDFGAGPGPYAIETLRKLGKVKNLRWRCVDLDQMALIIGRKRVRESGLDQIVSFEAGNFMSRDSYPASPVDQVDFGLMIGILCGMTCEDASECLSKVKPHFKPGGEIIAATLLTRSFEEDPRTYRMLCNVLGWQLRPKSLDEVRGVFETAGWQILNISSERADGKGQYAIVHAKLA